MTPHRTKERTMIRERYTQEKKHTIYNCPGKRGYTRSAFDRLISSIEITDDLSALDPSSAEGIQAKPVARGTFKLNGKKASAVLVATIARDEQGLCVVCDWRFHGWVKCDQSPVIERKKKKTMIQKKLKDLKKGQMFKLTPAAKKTYIREQYNRANRWDPASFCCVDADAIGFSFRLNPLRLVYIEA